MKQKTQAEQLEEILLQNNDIRKILRRVSELGMPNWYLGAGGVAQTVWNVLHDYEPSHGIKDYDLVYYNAADISYEGEDVFIQKGAQLFKDLCAPVEIRNQARVHLWYEKRFGYPVSPFRSVEEAIGTWPTTVTCVGIKSEDGRLAVHAPYGLDDLFALIVRPNKVRVSRHVYEDKVRRWKSLWPKLTIVPWESEEA